MKILVTGGSGLTGKSLQNILPNAVYLSSKDYNLINLNEVEKMYKDHNPTHVVHLAARVGGIMENVNYPCDFFEENILMNSNVILMARKYNVERLTAMLTSCSYPDVVKKYPMEESDFFSGPPTKFNFSYAIAKRAMATQIDASNVQYGTKYNYLIPCNLYGEHDNFDNSNKMHFITALIKKIYDAKQLNKRNITLFGTGKPLRQFMHSHDLARVIKIVIQDDVVECFNVAPPNQNYSVDKMARLTLEVMKVDMEIVYDSTKPDGQYNKEISTTKFTKLFPDFEFMSFEEGIHRVIKRI